MNYIFICDDAFSVSKESLKEITIKNKKFKNDNLTKKIIIGRKLCAKKWICIFFIKKKIPARIYSHHIFSFFYP